MNFNLLLFLFTLSAIAFTEHFASGKSIGPQRSRRVALFDSGNFIVVDGFVNMVNGKVISGEGCYYHDGKMTDYGKTRALTSAERVKLKQYMDNMHKASAKFAQQMQRMFDLPFPFGPPAVQPPQMSFPKLPCFCSSSTCSKVENSMGFIESGGSKK